MFSGSLEMENWAKMGKNFDELFSGEIWYQLWKHSLLALLENNKVYTLTSRMSFDLQ